MDNNIAELYPIKDIKDHVLEKNMWAGEAKIVEKTEFIISRQATGVDAAAFVPIKYSQVWYKCLDEILVNAMDQLVKLVAARPDAASAAAIAVEFTAEGEIKVTNTGQGIDVVVHPSPEAKGLYIPELIFGEMFKGSNLNKKTDLDDIVGGTNGVGAKIANIFSTRFVLETVDAARHKYYYQKWTNNMKEKAAPIVVNIPTGTITDPRLLPHTTIAFLPEYTRFGYLAPTLEPADYNILSDMIYTRCAFAAAYCHYIIGSMTTSTPKTKKKAAGFRFTYNGKNVPYESMAHIAQTFSPQCHMADIVTGGKYPAEIAICIADCSEMNQISNVNGVVVTQGKHIASIHSKITAAVKDQIMKALKDKTIKFSPSYITNNVFVFGNFRIPRPSWSSQRKDVLGGDAKEFAGFEVSRKLTDWISKNLKDYLVEQVVLKTNATGRDKTIDYSKYTPARHSGPASVLICVEGDSAMNQVITGITSNKSLGFAHHGVISLGGVPINVRKECSIITVGGKQIIKKSKKLLGNVLINTLLNVTGLDLATQYSPGSKEFAKLKYGAIVLCVDQDTDGVGNICGQILNLFEMFWPSLYSCGFIKRFATPIIRAYPKTGGKVSTFYTQADYVKWLTLPTDASKYVIKYYKGLGTHSKPETVSMFSQFQSQLITYSLDEAAKATFETYFGKDPDTRKRELALPTDILSPEVIKQIYEARKMTCTTHLRFDTNLYQKDNLGRKLDSVIDGMNESARKIYDGCYKAFAAGNKQMKVAQLAGYVSQHENYHHGEASLADSITGKAFVAVGGKQLPPLVPLSNFGSRKGGGKDAASPRYIFCKLNRAMNYVFPPADYYILEFNFDEGKRSEPKYFMPIVPMAIVESAELPAHGWKLKIWGRDIFQLIDLVEKMIQMPSFVPLNEPAVNTYGWHGQLIDYCGQLYSVGKYEIIAGRAKADAARIIITELPLRVWTDTYFAQLLAYRESHPTIVKNVINESSDDTVRIIIELFPGALDVINGAHGNDLFDPIVDFFRLRDHMDSHINLMGPAAEVIEFSRYIDVIKHWFPWRKKYYQLRIDRTIKLLELKIRYYENIIDFLNKTTRDDININMTEEDSIRRLSALKLQRFNHTTLFAPKFTPVSELESAILEEAHGATYDYLLNLPERTRTMQGLKKQHANLDDTIKELEEFKLLAFAGEFPGAAIWLQELRDLRKQIEIGRSTAWMYEATDKYTL